MDGWNKWLGKKVFLRLKTNRIYSGEIINVDNSTIPITFLTIKDKYGMEITFVSSEILEIKEER